MTFLKLYSHNQQKTTQIPKNISPSSFQHFKLLHSASFVNNKISPLHVYIECNLLRYADTADAVAMVAIVSVI